MSKNNIKRVVSTVDFKLWGSDARWWVVARTEMRSLDIMNTI